MRCVRPNNSSTSRLAHSVPALSNQGGTVRCRSATGIHMKTSIDQCRYHLRSASEILARLDDSHLALEPQPGAKTAGWLIGHLDVTGDFARRLCGSHPLCPREWRAAFNPGTRPSTNAADDPGMQILRENFLTVYSDLLVVASNADQELLAIRNPFEPARVDFATAGDFVAYLMSSHLAYHLGQLSGWYAAARLTTKPQELRDI